MSRIYCLTGERDGPNFHMVNSAQSTEEQKKMSKDFRDDTAGSVQAVVGIHQAGPQVIPEGVQIE